MTIDRPRYSAAELAALKYTIAFVLAGSTVFVIAIFAFTPTQFLRPLGPALMSLVAALAWLLLSRGRTAAAIYLLVYGLCAAVTGIAFFNGGIRGMAIIVYPQLILILGWLVGTRAAAAMALLAITATFGLVLAETFDVLPAPPLTPPAMRWIVNSFIFVFSVFLIASFVRSYQDRLKLADQFAGDLARSSTDLNRAQSVAHVGSWVYEIASDVMRLSAETCRISGVPEGTTGNWDAYRTWTHPDDRDAMAGVWQAALKRGEPLDFEHRIIVGGTTRWIRQIAEFELDTDRRALRIVGTTQDITERKQADASRAALEAQLRESQKMDALGTLAGGVAHDFNNALAAILGNVELARQDVGPAHPALESLQEIDKAGRRAKNLVQQILAFGRRQGLERKVISLTPVVEEAARLLRATLPAGISLKVECAPDVPVVLADANQIVQVLLNLGTNAWHALRGQERPGVIQIRLETKVRDGLRLAVLTVQDNGRGMDGATRSRIFEPFFTTKPMDEGAGLGLSVVHGIVKDHGASIEVESTPGEGASFVIYFPVAQPQSALAPAPSAEAAGANSGQACAFHGVVKHIFYLDDDEAISFLMTRMLERQGYRVSAYTDPREALAAARADPGQFDLAVTDYNMPAMSGLEVAKTLREIRPDLPVVLASGYITEELRAKAPAAGVSELIYKPDTVDDLCEAIARLAQATGDRSKSS